MSVAVGELRSIWGEAERLYPGQQLQELIESILDAMPKPKRGKNTLVSRDTLTAEQDALGLRPGWLPERSFALVRDVFYERNLTVTCGSESYFFVALHGPVIHLNQNLSARVLRHPEATLQIKRIRIEREFHI